MERIYNKLVRDNIPSIIKKDNEIPVTRILNVDDYRIELYKKLKEECTEVITSVDTNEILEELADVLEVLKSIAELENKKIDDIVKLAEQKRIKRGGFEKRIFLEKTITRNKIMKTIHKMNLNNEPYEKIDNGTKTVELRLYDEKRQLLKVNDKIEFTNRKNQRKLLVLIEDLKVYSNFTELYKNYDKVSIGYDEEDVPNPDDMNQYYPIEKQEKYGVVAIKIKKIK